MRDFQNVTKHRQIICHWEVFFTMIKDFSLPLDSSLIDLSHDQRLGLHREGSLQNVQTSRRSGHWLVEKIEPNRLEMKFRRSNGQITENTPRSHGCRHHAPHSTTVPAHHLSWLLVVKFQRQVDSSVQLVQFTDDRSIPISLGREWGSCWIKESEREK